MSGEPQGLPELSLAPDVLPAVFSVSEKVLSSGIRPADCGIDLRELLLFLFTEAVRKNSIQRSSLVISLTGFLTVFANFGTSRK